MYTVVSKFKMKSVCASLYIGGGGGYINILKHINEETQEKI